MFGREPESMDWYLWLQYYLYVSKWNTKKYKCYFSITVRLNTSSDPNNKVGLLSLVLKQHIQQLESTSPVIGLPDLIYVT